MGIYYYAVDEDSKTMFSSPTGVVKRPAVYHPSNLFPAMVVMKNCQGYNYQIWDDVGGYHCPPEYADITAEVAQELVDQFPDLKLDAELVYRR